MHRFFEKSENLLNDKIFLSKDNIKHLNVLRIEENEEFEIVIDGVVFLVKLSERDRDYIDCDIISQKFDENESNITINLYQGLPKSDKLEMIIQKSVELGVNSIIPFESSRTIVKWDAKKEAKKIKRYEEIIESASKQSKRSVFASMNSLISFNQLLEKTKENFTIVAYENRGISLKETIHKNDTSIFNIVIGPEGGFSEDEISQLEEAGAYIVNLGNRILRTETAAIALSSMIQFEAGDINQK
ncbi:16S rRNA (uracil(1498)-N(3))-methyltransferase [Helcococcus kunzii]|uniref:RsmE family RNA methyltransferase n=1 Tax=Helcococcus kunzii TaxID=40091 RepID=UPI001BAED87C|nr:RsmE family RNA methyltransferase [Helcococcus kunzii]QUY65153.1 16S rRNA (uracil(1498)-N(3))-methyltransferase [Helcococcus kunzii]